MTVLGKAVLAVMIPMNIAMVLWVWIGRGMFGATLGWIAVFSLFTAVPLLVLTLSLSTAFAFVHHRRRRALTAWQIVTQLALWLLLAALGAVIVDVDDVSREESILINLVGWSPDLLHLSGRLTTVLALAAAACWVTLMALLVRGIDAAAAPARQP
jgi:hypothetical protein